MKKWLKITLIIGAFLFLVVRALYLHWRGAKDERPWYVKNLGYHFSATVDSLKRFSRTNGLVYFHSTGSEPNLSAENRTNQKLKYHGSLKFILNFGKGKLAFHSRDLHKYKTRDSLVINSENDKIYIYHDGKLAAKSEISGALSGRPF
jgi:hypothetical protein